MISTIDLNKKNGEKVIGRFEVLNLEHIDKNNGIAKGSNRSFR